MPANIRKTSVIVEETRQDIGKQVAVRSKDRLRVVKMDSEAKE